MGIGAPKKKKTDQKINKRISEGSGSRIWLRECPRVTQGVGPNLGLALHSSNGCSTDQWMYDCIVVMGLALHSSHGCSTDQWVYDRSCLSVLTRNGSSTIYRMSHLCRILYTLNYGVQLNIKYFVPYGTV